MPKIDINNSQKLKLIFLPVMTGLLALTVVLSLRSIQLLEVLLNSIPDGASMAKQSVQFFAGPLCSLFFLVITSFLYLALQLNTVKNSLEMTSLKLETFRNGLSLKNRFLETSLKKKEAEEKALRQHKDNLRFLVEKQTETLHQTSQSLAASRQELNTATRQLQMSERMASIGNLVTGVAHEISTPLGNTLTGITFIQDKTDDLNTLFKNQELSQEDLSDYIQAINEISHSLQLSLKDCFRLLKSFKEISVDQASDSIREFPVLEYLREIQQSLRNILKKTELDIRISGPENIRMTSYPGAISQIFINLIKNTVMHGYPGLSIPKGRIEINFALKSRNKNMISFSYKDDGKGITDEIKEKVFSPYFTTARDSGGTGIGLPLINNLVTEKLNGEMILEKSGKSGVCFTINIPLKVID